jgi:starvation-inducible DNA-binding protein
MMHSQINNTVEELGDAARSLNSLLADEYQLYLTTRRAQREIKETNFNGMDKFFEIQFEILDKIIFKTDERVNSVGRFSPNSLNDFLKVARLQESNQETEDQRNLISRLAVHHKFLISLVRNDIMTIFKVHNDSETVAFLSDILEQHEKIVWMLRSHLT